MPPDKSQSRNAFVRFIGHRFLVVGGFLITTVGTWAALNYSMYWLVYLILIPLVISSLSYAVNWQWEAEASQEALQAEQKAHAVTRQRLDNLSTDSLIEIKNVIQKYALRSAANRIQESMLYIGRMCQLSRIWEGPLPIVRFSKSAGLLFATARIPKESVVILHENDVFTLVQKGKDKVRHVIAMLRVHQPPDESSRAVILRVEGDFNQKTLDAIEEIANIEDQKPSGFFLDFPFDPAPFSGLNFEVAGSVLLAMGENLNEVYLEEVADV